MIDGLRPYSEMKLSGLAWLGDVPAHWDVFRSKYAFREVDRRSMTGEEPHLSMSQRLGLVPASQVEKSLISESYVGAKLVEKDDLVLNRLKAHLGVFAYAKQSGLISPDYTVLRPKPRANVRFFEYVLKSAACRTELRIRAKGIVEGFWRLYTDDFYDIRLPVPSLDEQRLIVRFLDWHGAQTAKLIRAKKKIIALLNEQKQAIIHLAVTRGVDPNVKLKPSGIPWLGDVPEGWEVVPFKRRVGFQEGPGIMAADFRSEGIPLLRISSLHDDEATLNGCNFLDPEMVAKRWSHFRVRSDDYLLSSSASTGKVCRANSSVAGSIPYTGIIRLWPLALELSMPFLKYLIQSPVFQRQLDAMKSGVAIEHFGPTHLKQIVISLPKGPEQRAIVDYIENATSGLATPCAAIEREIALLQEFYARLIADVVTGKVDVRAEAASLPELVEAEAMDDVAEDDETPESVPDAEDEAA